MEQVTEEQALSRLETAREMYDELVEFLNQKVFPFREEYERQQGNEKYKDAFVNVGYEISSFGGNEIAINGIPGNLLNIDAKSLFLEMLADCASFKASDSFDAIIEKEDYENKCGQNFFEFTKSNTK